MEQQQEQIFQLFFGYLTTTTISCGNIYMYVCSQIQSKK